MKRKSTVIGVWSPLILLALMLVAGWALWLEPSSLRLVEHSLTLKHWPAAQSGLRIAVITDLHAGAPFIDHRKVERIVATTHAATPDLILLPGDFVIQHMPGGRFIAPEIIASWLAQLTAPLGVYAVLGNNDNLVDGPRVKAALEAAGIPVLDERSIHLADGRFDFWLSGIADDSTGHPDPKNLLATVDEHAPVIAFTHSPDVFPSIGERVSLLIAGHTHGGQVRLPFYGAIVTSSAFGKRYEIGHVVEQTDLYVCPGIGTSALPIRLLDPPEICLLNLSGTDAPTTHQAAP